MNEDHAVVGVFDAKERRNQAVAVAECGVPALVTFVDDSPVLP